MPTRPDIVLVMTDQQRFDQTGFGSGGSYSTPALDELARRGVSFTNAYSSAATCVPARIGILTGVQARRIPKRPGTIALREGVWTIAHALRADGYDTALIGKMHFTPMHANHGFDVMRTSEHLVASTHALRPDGSPDLDDYHQWLVDRGVAAWGAFDVGDAPTVTPIRPPGAGRAPFPYFLEYHDTTWMEREVRGYLAARDRDRPLFLVISFPHPHPPLNPPEPYASRSLDADIDVPEERMQTELPDPFVAALAGGTARFGGWRVAEHGMDALRTRLTQVHALVQQIDDAVRRLVKLFPLDRTVIAFTTDHGDFGGHRGLAGKVPWIPFDDLVRVPLVVAGAGIAPGREVGSLVQSSDLALTFCDVAGIEYPAPVDQLDSVPLTPFLASGAMPPPERPVLFVSNMGWPGARLGPLKLIRHTESGARVAFDLDVDPHETHDVAADPAYRADVDALDALVRAAMERTPPSLPAFVDELKR